MSAGGDAPRCPTCRAAFREAAECPRCGTDLSYLMAVLAAAHQLRKAGRLALLDPARREAALPLLRRARKLEDGESVRRLIVLAAALAGRRDEALEALRPPRVRTAHGPDPEG